MEKDANGNHEKNHNYVTQWFIEIQSAQTPTLTVFTLFR